MYYYDPNNDKSNARRWAGLAALLYALSIAAAFLFVSFDMGRDELLPGEGLLIDFGTTKPVWATGTCRLPMCRHRRSRRRPKRRGSRSST